MVFLITGDILFFIFPPFIACIVGFLLEDLLDSLQ